MYMCVCTGLVFVVCAIRRICECKLWGLVYSNVVCYVICYGVYVICYAVYVMCNAMGYM